MKALNNFSLVMSALWIWFIFITLFIFPTCLGELENVSNTFQFENMVSLPGGNLECMIDADCIIEKSDEYADDTAYRQLEADLVCDPIGQCGLQDIEEIPNSRFISDHSDFQVCSDAVSSSRYYDGEMYGVITGFERLQSDGLSDYDYTLYFTATDGIYNEEVIEEDISFTFTFSTDQLLFLDILEHESVFINLDENSITPSFSKDYQFDLYFDGNSTPEIALFYSQTEYSHAPPTPNVFNLKYWYDRVGYSKRDICALAHQNIKINGTTIDYIIPPAHDTIITWQERNYYFALHSHYKFEFIVDMAIDLPYCYENLSYSAFSEDLMMQQLLH